MTDTIDRDNYEGVAVIGMSGRFPGASNLDQFWQNLVNGVDSISRFSKDELEFSVASKEEEAQGQEFIRARAVLNNVDQFDASFFGIYPREAQLMDPQHRLFLECAWEALEAGGYNAERYPGLIGVYSSLSLNTYLLYNLCANRRYISDFAGNYQVGFYQEMLGNDKDFLPTRVSYKLNLKGPSMSIQTACSSSLVAICEACNSLLTYRTDMALSGGVSISFPQKRDYLYQEEGMVSGDGMCRVFDAESKGTVFGHGVAVLLLKRLEDAVADRDTILGVIKGSAVNNDGSVKIGYAAPSIPAQAEVIAMAQASAGAEPESISYIEAHGTGTPLGDPIEIAALTQAFRNAGSQENGYCAIGTCKTNIGHLDVASGATGLIKTILQLQHELIPPLLHYNKPNPKIDFDNSPFVPVSELTDWKKGKVPRRAGVSSFGVGGTNAHLVVEEAPPLPDGSESRPHQLLILSAKTESALERMKANLADHFEAKPEMDLADAAYTLQNGRKPFLHRWATIAEDINESIERLRVQNKRVGFLGEAMKQEPSIVFMFPGQGSQYPDMGRELYYEERVFRKVVDHCANILEQYLEVDIRDILYPDISKNDAVEINFTDTWVAQPAIFIVEYALATFLESLGIRPTTIIGHSIGEYVAAVLSGVYSLEDALQILSLRAKLMQALPSGSMLSVRCDHKNLEKLLQSEVSIAAINSPVSCVVSGPTEAVEHFQKKLESEKIISRILHTSHAFHSQMMEPMLEEFKEKIKNIPVQPPQLNWISTYTGKKIHLEDFYEGNYWVGQLRHKVRFSDAIRNVIEDPQNVLLEVGPGQTLSQLARQNTANPADKLIIASLGPVGESEKDLRSFLSAIGRLWISGVNVDWESFPSQEERKRIPLPTYPFERNSYWVAATEIEEEQQVLNNEICSPNIPTKKVEECYMKEEQHTEEHVAYNRKGHIIDELKTLFQTFTGADHSQSDPDESFMDLGFDSLLVTQASLGVKKKFGVKVTFRQMLDDLCTFETLAAFLDEKMPPDKFQKSRKQSPTNDEKRTMQAPPIVSEIMSQKFSDDSQQHGKEGGLLESVIQQQMEIMTQQLDLLKQNETPGSKITSIGYLQDIAPSAALPREPVITAVNLEKQSHFGPFKSIEKGESGGLTNKQQAALETLVERYNIKTAKSKELAQKHRRHFCDPRAAGNFRQLWKEMVYPIACARSKGSRIWDIDGNEYIDITMGFGTNYMGHSPEFVMNAVTEQLELGVEIGPQSPIAGEVAQMICEFSGMERATFCNTGSEAVMASFRVARTVTGREKIVYFYGDYHGIFDEVLGRPAMCDGILGAMPIAPGIPHMANIIILQYGDPSALDTITQFAEEIAAVVVEPVQSRHPELQPKAFLQQLREVTKTYDIALVFDEVITGFRVSPGGAQEYFDVKADMATYGKVIGGGMPIGVLAGSADYMDALDGGFWQYGDTSSPPTGVTFFAGTFVRHPLAMAAARAVLKHLKTSGPALQDETNKRTKRFVEEVNYFFEKRSLPMRFNSFSAMFYYDFHPDLKYASLLFYYLRDKGVHIWEGRVGHLSIAHTDHELDRVVKAIQDSIDEMQKGGFLPESGSVDKNNLLTSGEEGRTCTIDSQEKFNLRDTDLNRVPLSEAQHEMWIGAQLLPEAAGPHHACTGLYLNGELDITALTKAITTIVQRHEGLHCTFSEDGSEIIFNPLSIPEIDIYDFSQLAEIEREKKIEEILHQEGKRLFDLTRGPLVKFQILKLSQQRHLLIFTAQMIVCDGWSHYVVFEELGLLYNSYITGEKPDLQPAVTMREFAQWEIENKDDDESLHCENFWIAEFKRIPPPIDLPTSQPRIPTRMFEGARQNLLLSQELCENIKKLGREQKNSYFAVLMAAFQVWLYRLSETNDLVIGVPFASQSQLGMEALVGQCANILPLRIQLESSDLFSQVLNTSWSSLLDAQENWNYSFGRLIPKLKLPRDSSRIPLVSVLFNIDPPMSKVHFDGIEHRFITGPRYYFQYDLGFNLVEGENNIIVECDYNPNLFDADVIKAWLEGYLVILETVSQKPDYPIGELPMSRQLATSPSLIQEEVNYTEDTPEQTISSMFTNQVKKTPELVAVMSGKDSLTYEELDLLSNRLGNFLISQGVTQCSIVGILNLRPLDLAVAMLAIAKIGAAYALVNQLFSKDDFLQNPVTKGISKYLMDSRIHSDFPGTSSSMIDVHQAMSPNNSQDDGIFLTQSNSREIACVLVKKEKNGRAKTISLTHEVLVNCFHFLKNDLGIGVEDNVLWHNTDGNGLEISAFWLPILVGATCVISKENIVDNAPSILRVLSTQNITVMLACPSAWQHLVNLGWNGDRNLKVLCWGEIISSNLAKTLSETCNEVWNLYGVIGISLVTMIEKVTTHNQFSLNTFPDNENIIVVDRNHEQVPIGVPGEILIRDMVAPTDNSNDFISTPDSFIELLNGSNLPVSFLRTGDLAYYKSDGRLRIIGRMCRSFSVKGSTFHALDVEAVLSEHSAVRDVVVDWVHVEGTFNGLVAYVVLNAIEKEEISFGLPEQVRELSRLLRRKFPNYMVPDRFVVLENVPRQPDGRVQYQDLPIPGEDDFGVDDYVEPQNETEKVLANIWCDLLNLENVSVRESFFDLGGQSLLAVRLFAHIEKELGYKFPIAMLFRAPTIEQLAKNISADKSTPSTWPSLVPIQPRGDKTPLILVHGAGGNVLLYRALAKYLEPDYPLYGLQSQGLDGKSNPLKTIEEMADCYLQEILEIQPKGPYLLGGYCLGGTIAYEVAQRLTARGETVNMVAMLDTYNFFRALKSSFLMFILQKIRFHFGNFLQLRPGTMWKYFKEKKRVAGDGGWSHIRTERPGTTLQEGVARAESGIEASVQELNDHAADIYDPKPYTGTLTLFKPQINYKFYPDPKMGWGNLALGGLDIVEMPINPHAMLLEPHVKTLAQELKLRMDREL